MSDNQTLYLKDYKEPDFAIENVNLVFDIHSEQKVEVHNEMNFVRKNSQISDLILDGSGLQLKHLSINGKELSKSDYEIQADRLTLFSVPDQFELKIVTLLNPEKNKSYEGLYLTNDSLVTQNEAQGFRKITYFLDRPDVMSSYVTKLIANKNRYPVLLANGNLKDQGDLEDGRHFATWEDPHKKPCYLFAIVAGNLARISDRFTTRSGREVDLHIYCSSGNEQRCHHAMTSLKQSMTWDEEKYDLEYDLDVYNIVSVDNFNAGAMENKGLNIFNSVYINADEKTATDDDYQSIAAVIAHEYFHNWTGNRITLRDWFQLSLKEGLTVFRDQQFSMDYESKAVKRINDVDLLRTRQFAQDAGPTAHPVRPQSVISVDNFFTVTIYEKGAELIRMIKTIIGDDAFAKGMDLYFKTFDGQAVTTEDFVWAFEKANDVDLSQFKLWYDQSGTPRVAINDSYNSEQKTYTLEIEQSCPATPGQKNKKPFHIPLKTALLDGNGKPLPLIESHDNSENGAAEKVLNIRGSKQSFVFQDISEKPTPSFLREFSAPVVLEYSYSDEQLAFLMSYDNDSFARWEAGQKLTIKFLLNMIKELQTNGNTKVPELIIEAIGNIIRDQNIDDAYKSVLLSLPDESYISQFVDEIDVESIHTARKMMKSSIAEQHSDLLFSIYNERNTKSEFSISKEAIGKRSLKNIALGLLSSLNNADTDQLIQDQFANATNMTDEFSALSIASRCKGEFRHSVYQNFYDRWQTEPLVMNKWLKVMGASDQDGNLQKIQNLMKDKVFNIENPNKVYSLLSTFCNYNPIQFHNENGQAYEFAADQILTIDKINPHVSSYLATAFNNWRKFPDQKKKLMERQLRRIISEKSLSKNTYEIISKNLHP